MSESGDRKRSREVEEGAESATEQLKSESEEPGREKGQPDNNDFIQTLLLEEKSNDLAHERKWESAKEALEKLSARPCDTKLRLKLMSIECSLELEKAGNEDGVKNDIEELKKIILQYKCPDIESVNKLVNYYITKKRYIRALVLVQCIHDVYQHKTSSLEVLGDIQIYILYMVNNIVGEQQNIIHESWKITTSLGDLLSLPSFEGVDDQKKNIDFTVCQNFLGSIFNSLGMYSKGLQNSETAMKLAEEMESGYFKNTVLAHSFQNCVKAMDEMGHETESDMYNDKLHVTKEKLKKYEKEVTEILSLELTERYLQKSKRVQLMRQTMSGGPFVGFGSSSWHQIRFLPSPRHQIRFLPLSSIRSRLAITNPEAEFSSESELAAERVQFVAHGSSPRPQITIESAGSGLVSTNPDEAKFSSESKLAATRFTGMGPRVPFIELPPKTSDVSPSIEISSISTSQDEAILPSVGKPAVGGLKEEQPNISPVSTSEITSTTTAHTPSELKPTETPEKEIKQIPSTQKTKKATVARSKAEFAENLLLEEKINSFVQDREWKQAKPLLERLPSSEYNFRLHLMMIECGLYTFTSNEMMKTHTAEMKKKVKKIKGYIDVKDLDNLSLYYEANDQLVRAMMVTLCVYHLSIYQGLDSSTVALRAYKIMKKTAKASDSLSKIVADLGMLLMQDNLKAIKKAKNLEEVIKTKNEALCLSLMGSVYNYISNHQLAIKISKECLKVLEQKQSDNGFIAGRAYHNIGYAHEKNGNSTLAKESYKKALNIKKEAQDFTDEESKQNSIESARRSLEALDIKEPNKEEDIQNYEDETENLLEEIEKEIVESIKTPAMIRKRIGKDGGSMELLGCSMHFPVAALKKETDIEISVDTNPENFPKDCVPVSPILHCSPSIKFNKRVTVEMELSCILQEDQQIDLLCKKRGSASGWNRVESSIQEDSSIARFYLDHFCSYFASFKQLFGIPVLHKFINDVYMRKDTGLIASVFSKNRKIHADSDLCLKEKQFMSILPLRTDVKVFKSESLNLQMKSNKPENTEVQAKKSGFISVDEDFLDSRQGISMYFNLCPALDKKTECNIDIDYEIQRIRQDGTKYPNPTKLVLDSVWPIPIEKKEGSDIIMNVNSGNNNPVTAGTFVRDHGKSESTLKDSTIAIK